VGEAIRDIEQHPRGELFQRFLTRGPYWAPGPVPVEDRARCLPDDEVGEAIAFIYSFMVNTFQGRLAEMLALPSCITMVGGLVARGKLPPEARLYAGDSVKVRGESGARRLKAADVHILAEDAKGGGGSGVKLLGVVEVKSYPRSWQRLCSQLSAHLRAAGRGLDVQGVSYDTQHIVVSDTPVMIAAVSSGWRLPRTFGFIEQDRGAALRVEPGRPPAEGPSVKQITDRAWHVTLPWSKEALAAAAYELTFWYMAKVGEVVYAKGVPPEWKGMTPADAGRNAAKMALYYAILRAETREEEQRAIALYNAYGFGYALGTSFKNRQGSREMLWPEDLREILERGETKHGYRLKPPHGR